MKETNFILDWCTVTIKPDLNANQSYLITLEKLLEALGLVEQFGNFVDLGAKRFYSSCYRYKGIAIYASELSHYSEADIKVCGEKSLIDNYYKMGISIEMSGEGCRYYSSLFEGFTWKMYFQRLRDLQKLGCSLNICRTDYALDDYEGYLNMDIIERCALNYEYVSLFRVNENKSEQLKIGIDKSSNKRNGEFAKTVYFGNRKSNCFCRIYDKKLEQLSKYHNNKDERERLEVIPSWVRFEIVFRNNSAIKIINAMLELSDEEFSKFLATAINKYIRFCKKDNKKSNRRTVYKWWTDFIGTIEVASLKVVGLSRSAFNSALDWVKHSCATTMQALIHNMGIKAFLEVLEKHGSTKRFKPKHFDIANGSRKELDVFPSDIEKWAMLCPAL